MSDLEFSIPSKSDFKSIFLLLEQLWPDKKLYENNLKKVFLKGLNSQNQEYIILKRNNQVIGFISLTIKNNLWQEGNLGHIDDLIIDENYRGKNYGTKLIEKIIDIAKKHSCKRIELDSAFHRKKAHKFYEKKGFINRAYVFSKSLL